MRPTSAVIRLTCLSSLVLAVPPTKAAAQFGLVEKALEKVEAAGVHHIRGISATDSGGAWPGLKGMSGWGFELGIGVGSVPGKERDCEEGEMPDVKVDTLENRRSERRRRGHREVTTRVTTREVPRKCAGPLLASFQLALGYSQIGGLESRDPAIDLRGAFRELPSVAFYATMMPDDNINLYAGIRTGLVQLHSVRGYEVSDAITAEKKGPVYPGGGSTFQAGVALGIIGTAFHVLDVYVEGSYHWRKLNSVEWTGEDNIVPTALPRELNFSGGQVTVGVGFPFKPGA